MDTIYIPNFEGDGFLIVTIDDTNHLAYEGFTGRTYIQFVIGEEGQNRQRTYKIQVNNDDSIHSVIQCNVGENPEHLYTVDVLIGKKEKSNEVIKPYYVFPYNINPDRNASLLRKYNEYNVENKHDIAKIVAVKESFETVNNEEHTFYDFVTDADSKWQISGEDYDDPDTDDDEQTVVPKRRRLALRATSSTKWSYRLKL